MTTELSIQNLFEGKEVRILEKDNDLWMPITDLASAWGTDRTTPYNLIIRNAELFTGMTVSDCGDVTSPTGICVNERGLYLLMGKISASRLKHPAAKESIIRFQRWVPELIQKYRKKEIVQVSEVRDYPKILDEIKFAKELSAVVGTDPLALYCQILDKHELGYLGGLLVAQKEPIVKPVALPKPKDYLTATDIGDRIGKTSLEVKNFLYNQRLLNKDDASGFRLTEAGKAFASEYAVEVGQGAIVWRIRWKKDVLRLFNIYDHVEMG